MNSARMKVSTRLIWAFGSIAVLVAILILLGLNRLAAAGADFDSIVEDRLPKVRAATNLQQQVSAIAIALRNMMLNPDPTDRLRQVESIETSRKSAGESMAFLEKTTALPKGKEILQRLVKARQDYLQGQNELLGLIQGGKSDEAREYLANTLRPRLRAYQLAAQELENYQEELITGYRKEAHASFKISLVIFLSIGAAALAVSLIAAWLIVRNLSRELGGEPHEAAQVALAVAEGDLTRKIPVRPGDAGSLMAILARMQESLAKVVSNVRQGSEAVATASAQIAQGNQDLSSRTESQASSLEETAASMEELGSTVKQNADNARQANQLAQSASTVAVKGGEVVAQVVDTMSGINDSSRRIADIINVIDGIAFQTNILALNAAVEAARAGEQGRGFAVVAGEVRNLASRSAEAAKEIKQLITESVNRVEQGTALVDQAGATMNEVVASIRRVTDIMGEISAASAEQSAGVSQVGEAVTNMDQVTQQNAALVEEMAAAASSLNNQAQDLVQTVAVFKLAHGQGAQIVAHRPAAPIKAPAAPATAKPASKPAQAALSAPASTASKPAAVKTETVGDDWESF